MVRIYSLLTLIFFLLCSANLAAVELDADNNGGLDISFGGTNASSIAGALQNLGLDQLDNTSDAAKPVSSAVQTALDGKQDNITGSCVEGNAIRVINSNGSVVCEADDGGVTNLGVSTAADSVTVSSDTGVDAVLPAATITNAGVFSAAQKTKLDSIEDNATSDQSAAEVPFFPTGSIEADNMQAALQELDTEKFDPASPGDIGVITPGVGGFTTLTANFFDFGAPSSGETGEVVLLEDPDNGSNVTGFKAPSSLGEDHIFILPGIAGTNNTVLVNDGADMLSWQIPLFPADIGSSVQAYDADLADLADGSLSGGLIGAGISGSNITTGTVAEAFIDSAIARDSELNLPVSTPATATEQCTAGQWSYDTAYFYICTGVNQWARVGLSVW